MCRQDRLNLRARQVFFATSGVNSRAGCWNWAVQAMISRRLCPTEAFFNAADKPVLPIWFPLGHFQRHAHDGGALKRQIALWMARTIPPVTATSAI